MAHLDDIKGIMMATKLEAILAVARGEFQVGRCLDLKNCMLAQLCIIEWAVRMKDLTNLPPADISVIPVQSLTPLEFFPSVYGIRCEVWYHYCMLRSEFVAP